MIIHKQERSGSRYRCSCSCRDRPSSRSIPRSLFAVNDGGGLEGCCGLHSSLNHVEGKGENPTVDTGESTGE